MRISKKVAIRFLSMIMALAMCFSLSATAFAMDVTTAEGKTEVVLNEDVAPLAQYKQLAIIESGKEGYSGTKEFTVCPDKGAALWLKMGNTLENSSDLTVKVTKNGGWWASKTITIPRGQAIRNYELISNCNGEVYTISITGRPAYFAGIAYQQ